MTKISIVSVGRDKQRWVTEGCRHFVRLLSRYARVELETAAACKRGSSLSPAEIRRKEALAVRKKLAGRPYFALADDGVAMDSGKFAKWLEKTQVSGRTPLVLVMGGPYGLDESILKGAERVISLSPLTFSHQLVRLVVLEQLFRAFSIIHGTDYHK
ncbi:MAG: 23S rRNA (pseudouridine(1915)-N(3))-methyltransferase RlmH [Candidatus Zixiibacteriota bacterium]|nr:MAG: 23S rRNA (pseudouridine(1915)-N(3))-methyltransferase RlmH [candidate division Zixibacteria bacterium]